MADWLDLKKEMAGQPPIQLGPYFTFILRKSPRRLLHQLSYAKFAAKIIGAGKSVLDVGCSEGLSTLLLAEFAPHCVGTDIDQSAIQSAQANFGTEKLSFVAGDIFSQNLGRFDAVTSFDVIEHIPKEREVAFLDRLVLHLKKPGILVIGTPNITSDIYASPITKAGHINLYDADRMRNLLNTRFESSVVFSANDEVVHTGFSPLAHYLLGIGFGLKD